MPQGTVKWYDAGKRYGFIKPDQGGADVFVHARALEDSGCADPSQNDRVFYDLGENKGKTCAVNIKILDV